MAPEPTTKPSETDCAYAAGILDGEGCVHIAKNTLKIRPDRPYFQAHVVVVNTDRPLLEWLRERWGGYVLLAHVAKGRARRSWQWRLQDVPAGVFLRQVRPYVFLKLQLLDLALELLEVKAAHRNRYGRKFMPEWVYEKQRSLFVAHRALMAERRVVEVVEAL